MSSEINSIKITSQNIKPFHVKLPLTTKPRSNMSQALCWLVFSLQSAWVCQVAFWMLLYHWVSLFGNHSKHNTCTLGFREEEHCSWIARNIFLTTLTLAMIKHRKTNKKWVKKVKIKKKLHPPSYIIWSTADWCMFVPQMTNIYSSTWLGFGICFSMRQPCFNKHSFNHTHILYQTHTLTPV